MLAMDEKQRSVTIPIYDWSDREGDGVAPRIVVGLPGNAEPYLWDGIGWTELPRSIVE